MNITPKTNKQSSVKIIRANGRVVGKVVGNEFLKNIKTDWILRKPPAIASDLQALHDAERAGAEYCRFTCTDTGIIYRAPIAKIWDVGFLLNRGYGEQIALTLSSWTQTRDGTTHTAKPEYSEPSSTDDGAVKPLVYQSHATVGIVKNGVQMSLFGDGE